MNRIQRRVIACCVGFVGILGMDARVADAAPYTWTGITNGLWGATGNWASGTSTSLPTSGTNGVFYTGNNRLTGTVSTSYFLDGITFTSGATGSFVITGTSNPTLNMRGNIVNQSGLLQTIGGTSSASRVRIDYGTGTSTRLIDVGSGTIALNAQIQSSANTTLVKQGSGLLDITSTAGAQAFTGTLSVAEGVTNLAAAMSSATVTTSTGASVRLNPNQGSNYSIGALVNSGTAIVLNDVVVNSQSTLNGDGTVVFKTRSDDTVAEMTFSAPVTLGGALFVDVTKAYPNATLEAPQSFNLFTFSGDPATSGNFGSVTTKYIGETLTFSQNVDPDFPDLWVSNAASDGRYMTFSQLSGDLVVVPEPSTMVFAGIGSTLAGWRLVKRRRNRQRSLWVRLDAGRE